MSNTAKSARKIPHTRKFIDKRGVSAAVRVVEQRTLDGIECYRVKVKDGYHQPRYRIERLGARAFAKRMEKYLAKRPQMEFGSKKNLARKALYALPSFKDWSGFMPGALALETVHHPENKYVPTGRRLDPLTRRMFRHGLDAVAVRTRTLVTTWLAKQFATGLQGGKATWLSLAGGTSAPTLLMIHGSGLNKQKLTYINIDQDPKSLDIAKELIAIEGVPEKNITLVAGDIFDKALHKQYVPKGKVDIIDLMGIFEYLDDKQSIELLKLSYSFLRPGGIILACNMRAEHPQLNLHKRGMGWPGVVPRAVSDIRTLTNAAKIHPDNISIYQPGDGVYNVVQVRKR